MPASSVLEAGSQEVPGQHQAQWHVPDVSASSQPEPGSSSGGQRLSDARQALPPFSCLGEPGPATANRTSQRQMPAPEHAAVLRLCCILKSGAVYTAGEAGCCREACCCQALPPISSCHFICSATRRRQQILDRLMAERHARGGSEPSSSASSVADRHERVQQLLRERRAAVQGAAASMSIPCINDVTHI